MFIFLFFTTVLVTGVPAIFKLGLTIGLSGTAAPMLAYLAGGGIYETAYGKYEKPWPPFLFGLAMLVCSLLWISYTGWHINLFGYDIAGVDENLIGAIGGAISSPPTAYSKPSKVTANNATSADFEYASGSKARICIIYLAISVTVWCRVSHQWSIFPAMLALWCAVQVFGAKQAAASLRAGTYGVWNPNNGALDGDAANRRRPYRSAEEKQALKDYDRPATLEKSESPSEEWIRRLPERQNALIISLSAENLANDTEKTRNLSQNACDIDRKIQYIAKTLRFRLDESITNVRAPVSSKSIIEELAQANGLDATQVQNWFLGEYGIPPDEYQSKSLLASQTKGPVVLSNGGTIKHFKFDANALRRRSPSKTPAQPSDTTFDLWPSREMQEHQQKLWRDKQRTETPDD